MSALPHGFEEPVGPRFGLVVLQTDETIEGDMRRLLPTDARIHVTRVANAREVSSETLGAMEAGIAASASLLPSGRYDGVAYGCTSGTAVIGRERVASLVREGCDADMVSDPLSALIDACRRDGVQRLGFVSPYVPEVNERLIAVLSHCGVEVPHLTSFEVSDDRAVVRIDGASVERAAREMAGVPGIDAVFLSCTNLRTLDAIERLSDLPLPVWSSNLLVARALLETCDQ